MQSDPWCSALRICYMLVDTVHVSEAEAVTVGAFGLTCADVNETGRMRSADMSASREDEAHWVALMERIGGAQDRAAFAEVFRHYAPRVKSFLSRSGTGDTLAEECAQEVMATVWLKAHMFDASRASVATWIFTIARNRKIDALRKQRRPEPEELPWGPEAEPEPTEALVMQQESAMLGKALQELPAPQRELIERAYFGDLTHGELARETGLPLGTIKSRIRLGLERLRHTLDKR